MQENSTNNTTTLAVITQLAREREDRRKHAELLKKKRAEDAKALASTGKFGDSDFVGMIERFRLSLAAPASYVASDAKINVAVRKRPVSERERASLDHDAVTCSHPLVVVHHCKLKVDGITKTLENTSFHFDHAFDELATNEEVYENTCLPLVEWAVLHDGRSTCFAYGQTGSGKTHTMEGLHQCAARDVFACVRERKQSGIRVKCSFFELYGGQCLDLLNDRRVCAVREDGKGEVKIDGLGESEVADEAQLLDVLALGAAMRTTRCTEMNADSSRSHAIFQITLSTGGKLSLIDLAGSERGQDTKNHDATRRNESAAINRSLLALKECIRALDPNSGCAHVPYRGSKLTMVLKDSFAADSRTVMISCVSPAASSSDHTLNTLRYADRVKERSLPVAAKSPRSPWAVRPATASAKSPVAVPPLRAKSPAPPPSLRAKSPAPASAPRLHVKSPMTRREPARPEAVKRSRQPSPPPAPPLELPVEEDDVATEDERPLAASVAALIDEEEQVLAMHADAFTRESRLLAEESQLLSTVRKTVDYDVEEYVAALDLLLDERVRVAAELRDRLLVFKAHLRAEEANALL